MFHLVKQQRAFVGALLALLAVTFKIVFGQEQVDYTAVNSANYIVYYTGLNDEINKVTFAEAASTCDQWEGTSLASFHSQSQWAEAMALVPDSHKSGNYQTWFGTRVYPETNVWEHPYRNEDGTVVDYLLLVDVPNGNVHVEVFETLNEACLLAGASGMLKVDCTTTYAAFICNRLSDADMQSANPTKSLSSLMSCGAFNSTDCRLECTQSAVCSYRNFGITTRRRLTINCGADYACYGLSFLLVSFYILAVCKKKLLE